jgi:hypothetical protein
VADYLEFPVSGGGSMFVEVDHVDAESAAAGATGDAAGAGEEVKAGKIRDFLHGTVSEATRPLEAALSAVVRENAQTLLQAVDELEPQPEEAEITFGIKGNGEAGNLAVAKVGAEASYTVRIL